MALDPFLFHNVNFHVVPPGGEEEAMQAIGDCPFCGKARHFFVNNKVGLWDCKRCGKNGNIAGFLKELHESQKRKTADEDYKLIRKERGCVASASAYKKSGMVKGRGNSWLFPSYDVSGKMCCLRMYKKGGKIINTKGVPSGLWGDVLSRSGRLWICEGEWDGIALRDAINAKTDSVISVPGANVFKREWLPIVHGRDVVMAYDADQAGDDGMTVKGEMLKQITRSVRFIRWPLDVTSGYDVSDLMKDNGSERAIEMLEGMLSNAPRTVGVTERPVTASSKKTITFRSVLETYKKWLDLSNQDSVTALRLIMAIVMSAMMSGDPLWLYLVSPPGGGKTVLLNPLRGVPDHCVFRSNLTMHSLVSGWQGQTDPSLLPKLNGKTLVLKDMTELLSAPQHVQDEVFGTLRGAYDGFLERSYGNQVYRRYESRFNLVAGVTVQIHGHHQASMGERMLKFQISRTQKEQKSIIERAMGNLGQEDEMEEELSRVTGRFLRRELDSKAALEAVPQDARNKIMALAQLVAMLRMEVARDYRGDQVKFRPEMEVGTRLAKQLLKLGAALTATADPPGKFGMDEWTTVRRVALDTSIGWNLDVVQAMMSNGIGEMTRAELVKASRLPPSNVSRRLEDMQISGVVSRNGVMGQSRYKLCRAAKRLWKMVDEDKEYVERVADVRRERKYKIRPRVRSAN